LPKAGARQTQTTATGTSLVNFRRLSIFSRVFEHQFAWDGLAAGGVFSSRARADAQVLRASARATHAGRKPTLSIHFPRARATQKFRLRAMSRGMSFVRRRCAAALLLDPEIGNAKCGIFATMQTYFPAATVCD